MTSSSLEIDHIFVFVQPRPDQDPVEALAMRKAGFIESYRRDHPGQGTTNICYCFDNAYLELLWVTDETAIQSNPIAATRLSERSHWQTEDTCPFGIALRGNLPFNRWDYCPPYLPEGTAIAVTLSSKDPKLPFIFESPGGKRPDCWQGEKALRRQASTGFFDIAKVQLELPKPERSAKPGRSNDLAIDDDLSELIKMGLLYDIQRSNQNDSAQYRMILALSNQHGVITHHLKLPTCELVSVNDDGPETALGSL